MRKKETKTNIIIENYIDLNIKKYLNVKELGLYLGVSPGTIRVWMSQKKLQPDYKLGGGLKGHIMFNRKKIDKWVESHQVNPQ